MRIRTIVSWMFGLSMLVNVGCGWFGAGEPSGGLAVVDLDEIAKQVGAESEIATALKYRETDLNSKLQVMRTNYIQQFKDRKDLYGENPTDEQNEQLVSINRQINLNLVNARQQAKSHLTTHRSELILKFREQVAPVAEQIAKERGLSIVVPRNEGWLLAVDDRIDITDDVANALKATWKPIVVTQPATAPSQPQIAGDAPQPTFETPNTFQPDNSVQPATHLEPTGAGQP